MVDGGRGAVYVAYYAASGAGGAAVFEFVESGVVLGTGFEIGVALVGWLTVWVVVLYESGVGVEKGVELLAAPDAFVVDEIEVGLGCETGAEVGMGSSAEAVAAGGLGS